MHQKQINNTREGSEERARVMKRVHTENQRKRKRVIVNRSKEMNKHKNTDLIKEENQPDKRGLGIGEETASFE